MISYQECKQLAIKNNVKTSREWYKFIKGRTTSLDAPNSPQKKYKEWISWGDFLETKNVANIKKKFLSFSEAKKLIQEKGIKHNTWSIFDKLAHNIPSLPYEYYKKDWISWTDWFGNESYELLTYEEAVKFLKPLKCISQRDYLKKAQEYPCLPKNPYNSFKHQWNGWNEYLGTNNINTNYISNNYISYEKAQEYVKKNNITSSSEYKIWFKENKDEMGFLIGDKYLPSQPSSIYEEWESWIDFLGISEISYGEKVIKEFLNRNNIKYETQKTFDNCKFKHKLRYDFYLPKYNCLIEFDGKQHFEINEAWGGKMEFKKVQIRDKIKNEYAFNNNIKLIRISYYENISDILKNKLSL